MKQFVITEDQLQKVLTDIGECPYKTVQMAAAILVSLPELVVEEEYNSKEELLEG